MPSIGKTNLGANFYPKLVQISQSVGMSPEDIVAALVSESGLQNNVYNANGNAGGIFGAMPGTQKSLGFNGDWKDFVQLSGEEQLNYFKKYLENAITNAGGPIKSAAQFYVANFWPIAMRLPGIKSGDKDTVFLEKNPESVVIGGKKYSKKYYDIGIKIPSYSESEAYKANPLFDKDKKGYITLGDMQRQVDQNKKTSIYQNAIKQIRQSTNYIPKMTSDEGEVKNDSKINFKNDSDDPSWLSSIWGVIKKYLNQFGISVANSENKYLISIGTSDKISGIKYANILSTALQEYLNSESRICANENEIEIECIVDGDVKKTHAAIKQFATILAKEFNDNTYITVFANLNSNLPEVSFEKNEMYNRMFLLKVAKNVKHI